MTSPFPNLFVWRKDESRRHNSVMEAVPGGYLVIFAGQRSISKSSWKWYGGLEKADGTAIAEVMAWTRDDVARKILGTYLIPAWRAMNCDKNNGEAE